MGYVEGFFPQLHKPLAPFRKKKQLATSKFASTKLQTLPESDEPYFNKPATVQSNCLVCWKRVSFNYILAWIATIIRGILGLNHWTWSILGYDLAGTQLVPNSNHPTQPATSTSWGDSTSGMWYCWWWQPEIRREFTTVWIYKTLSSWWLNQPIWNIC